MNLDSSITTLCCDEREKETTDNGNLVVFQIQTNASGGGGYRSQRKGNEG